MRESSYQSSKLKLQSPVRGGEKKVMKKSLSFLVALALVFGLFASMASAADTSLTTAQKYQQFVDNKILKGDPSGDARLGATLTRAEFVTIADAITGLDTTSATTQTFSDVKKGQWWYGAIEAAAKAGLVNGVGQGKFGPKLNVTVEQAIKVFVLAAGLKPVDGASVDGSSVWAGPFIKAAQDAGFPIPSNYKANATRGQAIDLAYAAYVAKSVPTLSDVKAAVNADDTITVTGKVVGTADSVKVALGTSDAVAATLKDDKTFTYTTAKQAPGTYKLTVVAYDGTKASASVEVSATIDAFQVASVTVQNSKQIVVKFNKPVQEGNLPGGHAYSSAPGKMDYYALGVAPVVYPSAADLSDDKTTVTLTFDSAFPNNTYSQFAVSGVKSATGQTVADYKASISLTDTTAPSVNPIKFRGVLADITFSEPVKTMLNAGNVDVSAAISVNGVQVSQTSSPISYDFKQDPKGYVTLTLKGLEKGKTYNLNLVAVEDLVGNRANLTSTITVPTDTVAPTIASATVTGSKLNLTFSEPLDATTIDGVNGRYFKVSASGVSTNVYDTTAPDTANNNAVSVDLSSLVGSNAFINTTLTISGYQDLVGNKGSDYTLTATVTRDQTAPQVQTAVVSGNQIIIKLDEDVQAGSGGTIGYDFTSTDNLLLSGNLQLSSATYGNYNTGTTVANNYIVLTVAGPTQVLSGSNLKNGSYSISLPAGFLKDTIGNANSSAVTVKFTTSGNTSNGSLALTAGVGVGGGVYQDGSNPSVLIFHFNNTVGQSALNPSNYVIDGVPAANASVKFVNDYQTVQVTLPDGAIPVNGLRTVKVANIVDTNGNTLSSTTADVQRDITLAENIKPTAVSATLANDSAINVTFSENVVGVAAPSGVEIWINNVKQGAVSATYSGNVATLSLGANTFNAAQNIVVKFIGTNIHDGANNTVKDIEVPVK